MYTDEFPACCGITVLTDMEPLEGDVWNERHQDYDYKPDKLGTAQAIYDAISGTKNDRSFGKGPGLMLAVTAPYQKAIISYLEDFGFTILKEFINPIHGPKNKLILWHLEMTKVKISNIKKVLQKYRDEAKQQEKKDKEAQKKSEEKLKKKYGADWQMYAPW